MGMRLFATWIVLGMPCISSAADGGFILSISNPKGGPAEVSLLADGAEWNNKNIIKVAAFESAVDTSLFMHDLPAGVYWLKSYLPATTDNPTHNMARREIPITSIDGQRNRVEIKAGETVDLGRYQIDSLGGNVAVALPVITAPLNRDLYQSGVPQKRLASSVSRVSDALSANESTVLMRSLSNASIVGSIKEMSAGVWTALSSTGNLLRSQNGGDWTATRLLNGERAIDYSVEAQLLITEFGRVWSLKDLSKPELIARAPEGVIPIAIACNSARVCVVTAKRRTSEGKLTNDAYLIETPTATWRSVLSIPWKPVSMWTGQAVSIQLMQNSDEVVLLHSKNQLNRVNLGNFQTSAETLPFNLDTPVFSANRINIGERYSDDMGRTWHQNNKRLRDGVLQQSVDGHVYTTSINIDLKLIKPILRRSPDGKTNWLTVGELPTSGDLRVGRYSRVIYLLSDVEGSHKRSLWKSTDGGQSWQPDQSFNKALMQ